MESIGGSSLWNEGKVFTKISTIDVEKLVTKHVSKELSNLSLFLNLLLKGRMIRIKSATTTYMSRRNPEEFHVKKVKAKYDGFNIEITLISMDDEEHLLNNEKIKILL